VAFPVTCDVGCRTVDAIGHRRSVRFTGRKSEQGSALVELALCLPLLVLILVGTVDFARVFYTAIELQNGARAGAQYGASNTARSSDTAGMQSNATSAATDIVADPIHPVMAAASRLCQCLTDAGAVTVSPSSCTDPIVASCPHNSHRVMTVTVTATKAFTTIANLIGVPHLLTVSRAATLRVSE